MSKITLAALGKHCTFLAFVLSQTTAHPQRKRRGRSMAYFMWIQSKHMILSLNCLLKTLPQVIKMQHPFLCCESTAAPKNSPGQPALPRRTANITAFILAKTICSVIHRWHFLWFPISHGVSVLQNNAWFHSWTPLPALQLQKSSKQEEEIFNKLCHQATSHWVVLHWDNFFPPLILLLELGALSLPIDRQ